MNILIAIKGGIHPKALPLLKNAGHNVTTAEELSMVPDALENADVLVVYIYTKVDRRVLETGRNLKAVITCSAGTDHIDVDACKGRGIKVYNAPGSNANAVAEHAVALMLAVARRLGEADKSMRKGDWNRDIWGLDIAGKTIGFVGFGAIGRLAARKLKGFEVRVIAYDPYLTREQVESEGARKVELEELLKHSDVVSVHVPLSKETEHLIGERELGMMKKSAVLVNTARGGVVDEKALVKALKAGKIMGAGLDVFEKEPLDNKDLGGLPNVIMTPHIAAVTEKAWEGMCVHAVEGFLKDAGQ